MPVYYSNKCWASPYMSSNPWEWSFEKAHILDCSCNWFMGPIWQHLKLRLEVEKTRFEGRLLKMKKRERKKIRAVFKAHGGLIQVWMSLTSTIIEALLWYLLFIIFPFSVFMRWGFSISSIGAFPLFFIAKEASEDFVFLFYLKWKKVSCGFNFTSFGRVFPHCSDDTWLIYF